MATLLTLTRVAASCALAAAMLSACAGSQLSGSTMGTTPQTAGASNSQHSTTFLPDDGGGCGGDTQGGASPNDGGHGCCGDGGDTKQGGLRSNDDGGHHCRSISVTPHAIYFTASNPGPVTVTVHTRKQGSVSEVDDCGGATGIATVTQDSGNKWTVTAGAQQGSCKALFILKNDNGKKIGHAVLRITNFL